MLTVLHLERKENNKNDLASRIYPRLCVTNTTVTFSSLGGGGGGARRAKTHSRPRTHAITKAHARAMTYKHTELINFLTHSQKIHFKDRTHMFMQM